MFTLTQWFKSYVPNACFDAEGQGHNDMLVSQYLCYALKDFEKTLYKCSS